MLLMEQPLRPEEEGRVIKGQIEEDNLIQIVWVSVHSNPLPFQICIRGSTPVGFLMLIQMPTCLSIVGQEEGHRM